MILPNFIVIGAHKAGTTSLYHYLRAHPNIYMPKLKEARYFAFDRDNTDHLKKVPRVFPITTMKEYSALFDGVTTEKAIGEASPEYLNSEFAAKRIHENIPNAKLIVSLRNPIDRAYSLFMMAYRAGNISNMKPEEFNFTDEHARKGAYYPKLKTYIDLFGRQNIKVILFEELVKNSEITVSEIFSFLGVSDSFKPKIEKVHNQGGIPKSRMVYNLSRSKSLTNFLTKCFPSSVTSALRDIKGKNLAKSPPLDNEKRIRALELIEDDLIQLEALIGEDLSSWYKVK